jgi:hypothetical protein
MTRKKATYTNWLMFGFGLAWTVVWCRWPDSNRHGLRHCPLKTACLPIPPHRHGVLASDAVIQIEHTAAHLKRLRSRNSAKRLSWSNCEVE